MKTLLIATAFLMSAPLAAQSSAQADATATQPSSKVNTAVRADVAARPITHHDAPATVGDVKVRTARTGGKTVTLQNGALPSAEASAQVTAPGA